MTQLSRGLALAALLSGLVPAWAHAEDGFFLDDRAAVTAGAITATTRGSGGIWYNPAGIGGIVSSSLDLSGSAFRLQFLDAERFMQVSAGAETASADASFSTFVSAPAVLSYVRRLGDSMSIAFGVYVREVTDLEFRESVTATGVNADGAALSSTLGLSISYIESRQLGGLAWGWAITDTVRVGAALYLSYESARLSITSLVTSSSAQDPVPVAGDFVGINHRAGVERFIGAMAAVGVQWRVSDAFSLGFVARSPHQAIYVLNDVSDESFDGTQTDAYRVGFSSNPTDESEFTWETAEPGRFHLAGAWHLADGTLSAEVDCKLPFTDRFGDAREVVVNGRLGTWFPVGADFGLGGGVYTDLRDRAAPTAFGDRPVSYYGATLGGTFDSSFALSDDEDASTLDMSTTLALNYALGLGDVGGLHFDAAESRLISAELTIHEFAAHIGTSIRF